MPRAIFKRSLPRSASAPGRSSLVACAISIAALALWPARARATGGGDFDEKEGSFFAPEVIDSPDEAPFFRSGHAFYEGEGTMPSEVIEAVNRKEWFTYFGGKVSEANLGFLIYRMKLNELDRLIWTLEGKKSPSLSKETTALKAELVAVGEKDQVLRSLYYLGFAKRCEPLATRMQEGDWDSAKLPDASGHEAETADKLLAASERLPAAAKDKFLQERYRFQRMRLLFYSGRYVAAERYYAENIASFTMESSVKYRFMHAAAGSFYREKKYAPANYLSSIIFDRFPPLKRSAYLSFRPVEDADWKEALSMAKNDRERAVLWQLLGIHDDGLAAITKIYAMAPASNLLPLLLVREINKTEEDWWTNDARRRDAVGTGRSEAVSDVEAVGRKRLALVKRITDGQKAFKPYLWQLALGHLYALAGDTKTSLTYLDLAERSMPKAGNTAAQVRISRLFARVRALKGIDQAEEPYLAAELTWLKASEGLRQSELKGWVLPRLSQLYKKGGDDLRSLILSNSPPFRGPGPDVRMIDRILAFQAQPGKSPFDEFLAGHYGHGKGRLLELKALNELYAGRFKSAVDLLEQAGPEISNQPLHADPFAIRNIDCLQCDSEAKRTVNYTKASFVTRLLELAAQAQRKGAEGAQASFRLANGLYNMSCHGNARDVYSFSDGPSAGPNCKMDLAEKYYKRAMDLPGDKEFKARACFMAAKAEQNRYFNAQGAGSSENPGVHSPVYFKKLKDDYADTRYYQEIIRECGYFRRYLGR